ncbi:MAG: protoporphyrinogen/coproporphyrinogen oxidase [Candidatus Poseidoniaceae archaeon]
MQDRQAWIRHGQELRRPLLVNPALVDEGHVVVVGAGLSGLTAAYRLREARPDVRITVLERSDRPGGVIRTWRKDGWVGEFAVNASRPHPAVWRLIEDLGLMAAWQPSRPEAKHRWILNNGRRHRLGLSTVLKVGPGRMLRGIRTARLGGRSMAEALPVAWLADAMTHGIVNAPAAQVDADLLMPTMARYGAGPPMSRRTLARAVRSTYPGWTPRRGQMGSLEQGMEGLIEALNEALSDDNMVNIQFNVDAPSPETAADRQGLSLSSVLWTAPRAEDEAGPKLTVAVVGYADADAASVPIGYGTLCPDPTSPVSGILHESDVHHGARAPPGHRLFRVMVPHARWDGEERALRQAVATMLCPAEPVLFEVLGTRRVPHVRPGHMRRVAEHAAPWSWIGWSATGVAITHVVSEAERLADLMRQKPAQ